VPAGVPRFAVVLEIHNATCWNKLRSGPAAGADKLTVGTCLPSDFSGCSTGLSIVFHELLSNGCIGLTFGEVSGSKQNVQFLQPIQQFPWKRIKGLPFASPLMFPMLNIQQTTTLICLFCFRKQNPALTQEPCVLRANPSCGGNLRNIFSRTA
jgi:hypothetical protein